MKDNTSPLTYLYIPSVVTLCRMLGLALFVTHLAAVNSNLVIAQESNETMSLYSNPGANFEINYPSSWEKREFPVAENSSIIEFLGPSTGIEPRTPSVNVFIYPAGNQSVEQAVTEVINELEDIQVNSTTMNLEELNVTAHALEYIVTTAHQEFHKLQLWIEGPQRTYVITYTNLPDKFLEDLSQFMEMIKTISIA
jgi:hypothetical protein